MTVGTIVAQDGDATDISLHEILYLFIYLFLIVILIFKIVIMS